MKILVKEHNWNACAIFATIADDGRERKSTWIPLKHLQKAHQCEDFIICKDGYNFVELDGRKDGSVSVKITFIQTGGYFERNFIIPSEHAQAILSGQEVKFLYDTEKRDYPAISLELSRENLGKILRNKRIRRAFSKGLRDNFRWPNGGNVSLFYDGPSGFYFREEGGICGGFILHDYNGKAQFCVHT